MSETLEVSSRIQGTVGVVQTDGYINHEGGEKVGKVCNELIDEGCNRLLLNLEKSRIINSIGISILIEMIEKIKEVDGKIGFCCVTPTAAKTFRIMGLLKASSIHETEEDGLAAMSQGG